MKFKLLALSGAALVLLASVVACGGDNNDSPGDTNDAQGSGDGGSQVADIRTTKGLSAAALNAGLGRGNSTAEGGAGEAIAADLSAQVGSLPASADRGFAYEKNAGGDSLSVDAQVAAGGGGITVTGYGTATADADSAVIEIYIGSNGIYTDAPQPGVSPAIDADLQTVIDALVGAGVAEADVEIVNQGYYDPYYRSATIRAKVHDLGILDAAAQAGANAASNLSGGLSLQNTNITYTLNDCAAMERAALEAAAEDAADHAELLADVLNVTLGGISAASDYSYPYYYYWGYGGFDNNICASSYYGAIPFYSGTPLSGDATVEVNGNVSITYAIN